MARRAQITPDELIVDLFAGGGGASTAILNATGRHPDVAVNHDPEAIGVHEANHPTTRHYQCDVREVDPVEACSVGGKLRPVGLLWMSPDCTHFSKARGGKPVEKGIRSLADVGLIWAEKVRPRLIHLENVEEFQDWGPVMENGQPCPDRKGLDFRRWVKALEDLGYKVDWRELVAADYGAPTTRKRLFLIARNDGEPIRWPERTHAPRKDIDSRNLFAPQLKPWRAAAEIIDWSLPVPSIFDRKKPLRPKTLARIAKGIRRFVIESPNPFIVPVTHAGERQIHDIADPLRTVTGANRGELALTSPFLKPRLGERAGQEPRALDIRDPYPTVVPGGNGGDLAAVVLQKMNQNGVGTDPRDPLTTAMAQAPRHYEVAAYLSRQFGSTVSGRDMKDPAPTVMTDGSGGKTGLVAASIDKYYATGVPSDVAEPLDTATAKARFGLNAAYLEQANTGMVGHEAEEPVSTIVGKGCTQRVVDAALEETSVPEGSRRRQVLEFLWSHFGAPTDEERSNPLSTAMGRLRFGLVKIGQAIWQIADIGMRMLVPRELFNAQGFPPSYVIDRAASGRPVTKTAQTSMAGNSVSPPPAEATLRANLTWMKLPERAAA